VSAFQRLYEVPVPFVVFLRKHNYVAQRYQLVVSAHDLTQAAT